MPETEAQMLQRARMYGTGQIPYENEEDLLRQAALYAAGDMQPSPAWQGPPALSQPPAWQGAPQLPYAYDMDEDMRGFDQQTAAGGPMDFDDADMGGYPEPPQPPPAPNRQGFFYAGPVAGEAAARQQFNARPGVDEPLDRTGNYIAQQKALQFERIKSQYDAQRDIENAYAQAKNQQDVMAARSAEEFARQQNIQRAIESGTTPFEALAAYGMGGRGGGNAGSLARLMPQQGRTYEINNTLVRVDPVTGVPTRIYGNEQNSMSQIDAMDMREAMASKRAAQLALADPIKGINATQLNKIIADADAVINRVRPQAGQSAQTATASSGSPFPEGQTVRNKRDGKLYQIQNGVPVAIRER